MWSNQCCIYAFILLECFQLAQSAYLRFCYNGALDDYQEVPLSDGEDILAYNCFDNEKKTFFYIFGNNGTTNGPATTSVMTAAIALDDFNVILVDWQKEASSIDIVPSFNPITGQISYVFKGAPAAFDVGTKLGNTIVKMAKLDNGLNLETVYIVGHSLGAQLAAQAGRTVKKSNLLIETIIGLDPAGPLFGEPPVLPALTSDCASFVYTVRSDPGDYGTNKSLAHVDIFVNCKPFFVETDPEKQVQPGCLMGRYPKFSKEDICSHNFSWKVFTESLKLNHTLLAEKATGCLDWLAGDGNSLDYVNIGLDIDQSKRGVYFLTTNSDPQYGRGIDGLNPPSV